MPIASKYVIKEIIYVFEKGDLSIIDEVAEKFSQRYREDLELQEILALWFENRIENPKPVVEEVLTKLRRLEVVRSSQASGTGTLWLRGRRPPGG